MSSPRPDPLDRFPERWILALLVPRSVRESFEGDLLEEARLEETPRARRARVRRSLLRSVPALLRHPGHLDPANTRAAWWSLPWLVGPALVVALLNDVAAAPTVSITAYLAGLAILALGAFVASDGLRLAVLFSGVLAWLVAQFLGGDALGEGIYLLHLLPGTIYPSLMSRRCGRGPDARRSSA